MSKLWKELLMNFEEIHLLGRLRDSILPLLAIVIRKYMKYIMAEYETPTRNLNNEYKIIKKRKLRLKPKKPIILWTLMNPKLAQLTGKLCRYIQPYWVENNLIKRHA